jgi:hypothetical protein
MFESKEERERRRGPRREARLAAGRPAGVWATHSRLHGIYLFRAVDRESGPVD